MISAELAVKNVTDSAKAKLKPDAVFHSTMAAGDYHRQGDIYVSMINQPDRAVLKEIGVRLQLAPGTTQGSRHCISNATLRGVRMYEKEGATALDGPVLECFSPLTIDHPEHGSLTVPPGWFQITYQRQYAEELRRVQD